jgi:membrane protein
MLKKLKQKIKKLLQKIHMIGFSGMSLYDLGALYWEGIFKGAITVRASAISYSFFMAIFPFLLFTLTLIPLIPVPNFQTDFVAFIHDIIPPKTFDVIDNVIFDIATKPKAGLMSLSILLSVLFMTNGVNAILTGFEESVHKFIVKRNLFKQYVVALGLSLALVFILFLTVIAIVYFEIIVVYHLKQSGLIHDELFWLTLGKNTFYVAMMLTSASLLYYYGTKEGKRLRFISPGSIVTTLLAIVIFYFFQIYIDHFARYNQLYGSIGAFLIIMLMIWLNALVLLLGHELNMAILKYKNVEKQNFLETT